MLCFSAPEENAEIFNIEKLMEKLGFSADQTLSEAVRNDIFINGLEGFANRFMETIGAECNAFDRSRLKILCDAAAVFEGSPDEFIDQVVQLKKSSNSLAGTIQIMTYHKAKGLEFDIVFMPDLTIHNHGGANYLPEAQIIHYGDRDWLNSVRLPEWVTYLPHKEFTAHIPSMKEHIELKESDRILEKCCALYVGMTRARSALYILTSRNNNGGVFSPDKFLLEQLPLYGVDGSAGWLGNLLAEPQISGFSPQLLYSHGDPLWYAATVPELRESDSTMPALPRPAVRPEMSRERIASGEKNVEFVTDPRKRFIAVNGKTVGTQVHELFENIEFVSADFDAGNFAAQFEVSPAAANIFCTAMAEGSPVRNVLSVPEKKSGRIEVWKERRFLLRNNSGEIIPGAFDRVVIFYDGDRPLRAEIFDYKSDNLKNADEFAVYFPQLKLYRESLSQLLDLPMEKISCYILALKIKEVISVD